MKIQTPGQVGYKCFDEVQYTTQLLSAYFLCCMIHKDTDTGSLWQIFQCTKKEYNKKFCLISELLNESTMQGAVCKKFEHTDRLVGNILDWNLLLLFNYNFLRFCICSNTKVCPYLVKPCLCIQRIRIGNVKLTLSRMHHCKSIKKLVISFDFFNLLPNYHTQIG